MRKINTSIAVLTFTLFLFYPAPLRSQGPDAKLLQHSPVKNVHRFDYRDLGYWPPNLIEADNSKITSLVTDRESGKIYGATSGKRANLFYFSPEYDFVKPLGFLPSGQAGVRNALTLAADGMIYLGTGRDMTLQPRISSDWGSELGNDHIVKKMWADIELDYQGYQGGHIYRYDPANGDRLKYQADIEAIVEDLGIPVPGDGIYCLTASADGKKLYGITYPHGHFFVFDIAAGETKDLGPTWEQVIFAGPRRGLRSLPGQLVLDKHGSCYFSVEDGRLARYNPSSGRIERLDAFLPGEFYGEHTNYRVYHPVVESWTVGAGCTLYGGTNDGFLFRFISCRQEVENLGKVRISRRIRALTTALDGRVYGVAGEDNVGCTLFSYDPVNRSFEHYGPVIVDRSPYYAWYPCRFEACATGLDGTIYLGESDRKGHLFFLIPLPAAATLKDKCCQSAPCD